MLRLSLKRPRRFLVDLLRTIHERTSDEISRRIPVGISGVIHVGIFEVVSVEIPEKSPVGVLSR